MAEKGDILRASGNERRVARADYWRRAAKCRLGSASIGSRLHRQEAVSGFSM
jgi:hypothetical protein